jgi:serine/threonine protein kinase
VYLAEEVQTGSQYALKVVSSTEPSFEAELGILRTIAAQVRSKHGTSKQQVMQLTSHGGLPLFLSSQPQGGNEYVMSLVDSAAPAEGFPYRVLVMPYLPLTLETLINEAARQREGEAAARGALPVPAYTTWEVRQWVTMMAKGLAFLRFTCRISHGDLAPRNILIAGPNKAGVVSG